MATPKVLVLISGKAQHGKDSFADGLIRLTPIKRGNALTFKKYAFAKNVKATAYKLGWDGKKDAKGRAFLQAIGSNARAYDPDIWVRFLLNDLETDSRLPFIAISDCRYENEITLLKKWGGDHGYCVKAVRIERPNFDNGLSPEAQQHESEVALDTYTFDLKITNYGNGLETYENTSFKAFLSAFPNIAAYLTAPYDTPYNIQEIDGHDMESILILKQGLAMEGKPVITVDFDDTLLEKTGTIDRIPFFKTLAKTCNIVVVTSRSMCIDDIQDFAFSNHIPIKGVIYDSRTKQPIIDALSPLCHFDDDPQVSDILYRTRTEGQTCPPVFTMGEFGSPEYRKAWVHATTQERHFYLAHCEKNTSLDTLAQSKRIPQKDTILKTTEIETYNNEISL